MNISFSQPQGYQPPLPAGSNQGPLVPGQPIAVNNYVVRVERYLSQGGYAHVYVVTTDKPVHGTTRHVLKRIAVPDEAALKGVQNEVDIMRVLKGHPTIVYLIDASWNMLQDGTFEVFILMEFCSGGGIIDMMNRRLRERLAEAEILQIFVDVCEAVAAMHNLKPPLIHRDLKVENILQSSATSFKLCDFGSAIAVSKPPATGAEIRLLEADLNKHTTLQYRAPEMVDVSLRRRIDEKSDIWALGVLLYKLCFYTTPFEEHGPLAILNVQYKFPPYPVYSTQMTVLIASMLQEYGPQRPNTFELLASVHAMRGSRSLFTYVSDKPNNVPTGKKREESTALTSKSRDLSLSSSTLPSGIPTYKPTFVRNSLTKSPEISVPSAASLSKPSILPNLVGSMKAEEISQRDPWRIRTDTSREQTSRANSTPDENQSGSLADRFGESFGATKPKQATTSGFADSFTTLRSASKLPSRSPVRLNADKPSGSDAFRGLDGLTVPRTSTGSSTRSMNSTISESKREAPFSTSPRPTPSPRPSGLLSSPDLTGLSVEERFPPIHDLDTAVPKLRDHLHPSPLAQPSTLHSIGTATNRQPTPITKSFIKEIPSRSQQVTGSAMRNTNLDLLQPVTQPMSGVKQMDASSSTDWLGVNRPTLSRRHRSSGAINQVMTSAKPHPARIPVLISRDVRSPNEVSPTKATSPHTELDPEKVLYRPPAASDAVPNKSVLPQRPARGGDDMSSDDSEPENPSGNHSSSRGPQRPRHTRHSRQSSVHELVNMYDNSPRIPAPEVISPLNTVEGKSPPLGKMPLKSSLPITSQVSATDTKPAPVTGRRAARPQSLLIPPKPQYLAGRKEVSTPGSENKARAPNRRNSVSDLVEQYEAASPSGEESKPPRAVSPRNLSQSRPIHSPKSVSVFARADRMAATISSPPNTTENLEKPTRAAPLAAPSKNYSSVVPLRSRSSTIPDSLPLGTPKSLASPAAPLTSDAAIRPTSRERRNTRTLTSLLQADSDRLQTPASTRSESPERSFQGVGKLIQQWQSLSSGRT